MDPRLVKLVKLHEGFRRLPYQDTVGVWTVGYGTNLEARGWSTVRIEDLIRAGGVSRELAQTWLLEDLYKVQEGLRRALGLTWDQLDPVRRAVLMDMGYNMGVVGLLRFRKMITFLRTGNYFRAGEEMQDSRWFRQVKSRAWRLQLMMMRGVWPPEVLDDSTQPAGGLLSRVSGQPDQGP